MDLKYCLFFVLGLFLLVAGCTKAELSGAAGVPLAKSSCTETDKGRDYSIRGVTTSTVSGKTIRSTDVCLDQRLTEYYCDGGKTTSEKIVCPEGKTCSNGKCVAAFSCASVSHGVRVTDASSRSTINSNSCNDDYTVNTFSCTAQGTAVSQTSRCPEGTFCSTGTVDGRQVGQCVREVGCEQYDSSVIVANYRTDESQGYSDYCSGGRLIRTFCIDSAPYYSQNSNDCPQDHFCPEGGNRCIPENQVSCEPIQGEDGASLGVRITRLLDGSTQEIRSSCIDSQTMLAYACGQSAYAREQFEGYYSIALPSRESQECVDGQFVYSYSCENFYDVQGNPTITRVVKTNRDGTLEEFRSQCVSQNSISRTTCIGSHRIQNETARCTVYGGRYNTCATIDGIDRCISQVQ